jgi:hypothetical protein
MKLSAPQEKALRRSASTARPFRGHQLKTIESLYNKGLLTYTARLECTSCRKYDCQKHKGSRWIIWTEVTKEGRRLLEEKG